MKISINLLPAEFLSEQFSKTKFNKIQASGIAVITVLVFLVLVIVALRIAQNKNMVEVSSKVAQAEQKVASLKETQVALILLKDRLSVISSHWGIPSQQSAVYRLMTKLVPDLVAVNSMSIDNFGEAVFLVLAPDSNSLESLIENLTSPEINEGKIKQVSVESLNRGRDSLLKVSFKIKSQNI